jgi:uncharacterized protein (DUF885 family)
MKTFLLNFIIILLFNNYHLLAQTASTASNSTLNKLFADYYEEGLKLSPVTATFNGDNRYNNLLPAEFTDSYRAKLRDYYNHYRAILTKFKRESLSDNDKLSYDIMQVADKNEFRRAATKIQSHAL